MARIPASKANGKHHHDSRLQSIPAAGIDAGRTNSRAVPPDIFASPVFIVGVVQSLLWIAMGLNALRIVSGFKKIFQDFGAELPHDNGPYPVHPLAPPFLVLGVSANRLVAAGELRNRLLFCHRVRKS